METPFWSFIDWAEEWNDTTGMPPAGVNGPITMESLLYIYGLQHAAKLALFLDRREEAHRFSEKAEKVRNAVRTYCTGKNSMLQDGPGVEEYSQHCQVFAVLTDTVDTITGTGNLLETMKKIRSIPSVPLPCVSISSGLWKRQDCINIQTSIGRYGEIWSEIIARPVWKQRHMPGVNATDGVLLFYMNCPASRLGYAPQNPDSEKSALLPQRDI